MRLPYRITYQAVFDSGVAVARAFSLSANIKNFPRASFPAACDSPSSCKCFCTKLLQLVHLGMETCAIGVDASGKRANLVTPLDSGTPLIRSSFYVHLGLQIALNFVPEPIIEPLRRIEILNRARD